MSKKFEYNFTVQNEMIELRQRVNQLQQENNLLKQSLEQLIRVNTQLTQSIEEFNTENNQIQYQNNQIEEMTNTIEMLSDQIEKLRKENDANGDISRKNDDGMEERQTESLVNVLEELIDSFKNMQNKYEGEIQDFQFSLEEHKKTYEYTISKLKQEYNRKLQTMEPVIHQLNRKDENMAQIQMKLTEIERNKIEKHKVKQIVVQKEPRKSNTQVKKLEQEIQEKNRVIKVYQRTMDKLKNKFKEKI